MEAVDATVLTILGTAFGVMFATIITLLVGSMRVQHRDSTETRRIITQASKENRDLIDQTSKENRDLIGQNRDLIEEVRNENRDLIEEVRKENRELIGEVRKENRELIDKATSKLSAEFEEHKRVTERHHDRAERNHDMVISSLSDARERLARIEGHLGIGTSASNDSEPGADSSEAA